MMAATADQTGGHRSRGLPAFMAFSLLLHLMVGAAMGLFTLSLWTPDLDVTWLDLDNTLGAPKAQTPRKAPPRKMAAPAPRPKKPQPKKQRLQTKRKQTAVAMKTPSDAGAPRVQGPADAGMPPDVISHGPFTVDKAVLTELAPGDASLMLLLRMDRIRGSPFEQSVRRLLEVFYDHKTILWSSDVDLVRDFKSLLIATPNPYRVTETFLAGRYSIPRPVLRRALEKAARFKNKRLRWTRGPDRWRGEIPSPPKLAHDPRAILLDQTMVMLVDPKHIPLLESSTGSDAGADGGGWIEKLSLMDLKGGHGIEGPGMMLQAISLGRLVRLPPDLPLPDSFQVTIGATDPTPVKGMLIFSSRTLAAAFLKAIPLRIAQAKKSILLRFLGVTALLDAIVFKREERAVYASTQLTGDQVRSLLELFSRMIPQVRVAGMPERRPPDAGPVRQPDAGMDRPVDAAPRDAEPRSKPDTAHTRDLEIGQTDISVTSPSVSPDVGLQADQNKQATVSDPR